MSQHRQQILDSSGSHKANCNLPFHWVIIAAFLVKLMSQCCSAFSSSPLRRVRLPWVSWWLMTCEEVKRASCRDTVKAATICWWLDSCSHTRHAVIKTKGFEVDVSLHPKLATLHEKSKRSGCVFLSSFCWRTELRLNRTVGSNGSRGGGLLEVTLMPCRKRGARKSREVEATRRRRRWRVLMVALAPGKMHQRRVCRRDQLGV